MNKEPSTLKAQLVSRALTVLSERINTSKKNAKKLQALLEQIECDTSLSATEKKQLITKIHTTFILTTEDLLKIISALSAKEAAAVMPKQVEVVLADEVEKWAA